MTHDLFKAFADSFEVGVEEVVVHKLQEGVFYANIRCKDQNGETQDLDARTSDAIAVGVRFDCPIYTYESIMEEAGIYLSESGAEEFQQSGTTPPEAAQPAAASAPSSEREPMKDEDLTEMSTTDLNDRLNQAIEAEDYIMAAKIRDEINRRKGEED